MERNVAQAKRAERGRSSISEEFAELRTLCAEEGGWELATPQRQDRPNSFVEDLRTPYDIYKELDLGPGGYGEVPSTEVRRGAREPIGRKIGR